jgi:hypothetical protein
MAKEGSQIHKQCATSKVPVIDVNLNTCCLYCACLHACAQVTFFCAGKDTRALMSNCKGMWNQHQLKDEIKDHTTPGEEALLFVI